MSYFPEWLKGSSKNAETDSSDKQQSADELKKRIKDLFGSPDEFAARMKKMSKVIHRSRPMRITVNNERIYQFDDGFDGAQCIGQYDDGENIETWVCDKIISDDDENVITFGSNAGESIKLMFNKYNKVIRVVCGRKSPNELDQTDPQMTINFKVENI